MLTRYFFKLSYTNFFKGIYNFLPRKLKRIAASKNAKYNILINEPDNNEAENNYRLVG